MYLFLFLKQKTAYEMRISDWSSDVCSSDLLYHEQNWRGIRDLPYLWGSFVWVAFDLASDGRSEGDRNGINDKGLVTYDRAVRKDAYYWYQANWSDRPMLHLTERRHDYRTQARVTVRVYSNQPAVRLTVNGRALPDRKSTRLNSSH